MNLGIPGTIPSTSVPDGSSGKTQECSIPEFIQSRAHVRDTLKQLRAQNHSPLTAIRALEEYLQVLVTHSDRLQTISSSWRLPWTASFHKTHLRGFAAEQAIVLVTLVILLSHAASQSFSEKNYREATAHLARAGGYAKYLVEHPGPNDPADLSRNTAAALDRAASGLIHLIALEKVIASVPEHLTLSSVSASVHARVAVHASDQLGLATQLAPPEVSARLRLLRHYCVTAARLFQSIDSSGKGQLGDALGQLQEAEKALQQGRSDPKTINLRTHLRVLRKNYESENSVLKFQEIPTTDKVAALPTGRSLMEVESWMPLSRKSEVEVRGTPEYTYY